MRFEFDINLKKVRHILMRKEIEIKKEPSLRQNLILAYQLQQLFDNGKAQGLKEVGGWLNMTHARISQIMNLLSLAPFIQEEMLLSDNERVCRLTEHKIRKIAMQLDWKKQKELWESLTNVI